MISACRDCEATTVATPPAVVRRTASRASGAASTAATDRFSAWAWLQLLLGGGLDDAQRHRGRHGGRGHGHRQPGQPGAAGRAAAGPGGVSRTSGGSCRVTEAAVSTRSRSPGGGLAATARASRVAVSRKPRTSFSHGGQRCR